MFRLALPLITILLVSGGFLRWPGQQEQERAGQKQGSNEQQQETRETDLPAGQDGKRIARIRSCLDDAGKLYMREQYQESATKIIAAQQLLQRAMENSTPELEAFIDTEHRRLSKANELLSAHGIDMPPVPQWSAVSAAEDAAETPAEPVQPVSFKMDIAPLLVLRCGSCHIGATQGDFSMRTFVELMGASEGQVVVPGDARSSLIIQVLDDDFMPLKMTMPRKEVSLIRRWVNQGAVFDGKPGEESASIASLRFLDRKHKEDQQP
jgi:hypothetical protein